MHTVKELKEILSKLNDNEPIVVFVRDAFKANAIDATMSARIGMDMSSVKRLVFNVYLSPKGDKEPLVVFRG